MEYWIEGKQVTKEEFDKLNATLTEIENTYHCTKTVYGGRNSYEAKDASGNVWICKSVSGKDMQSKSIDRK